MWTCQIDVICSFDELLLMFYQQCDGTVKALPLKSRDDSSEEDSDEGWLTNQRQQSIMGDN